MLNFIYYPVSAILWFWHKVFAAVLGPASGIAWALSVVFLVFTLRALLFKPFVKQVRTQRQMQEFQPQIKALQKKYAGDKQKLAVEMQKLQKENGFNPIAGCLPVLAQAPVFIGLFHVLRSFNRTGNGVGQLGLTAEENRSLPNYVFSATDVQSFLEAKLFGAPLSSAIRTTEEQLLAFGTDVSKTAIIAVAVPLMIAAAIATHFTARASVARQATAPTVAATPGAPPAALMNKLILWVFPFFVLIGGPFLPIAVLLYWLSNNGWTLVQQHYVFGRMAQEEEAKKAETIERRVASAPKPGVKPIKARKPKPDEDDATAVSLSKNGSTDVAPLENATLPDDDGTPLAAKDTVAPRTTPTGTPPRKGRGGPTTGASAKARRRAAAARATNGKAAVAPHTGSKPAQGGSTGSTAKPKTVSPAPRKKR